tara:strand:+ start:597 stop:758 length:162 start_codon:yes stop_codon:yes gene_type:complete
LKGVIMDKEKLDYQTALYLGQFKDGFHYQKFLDKFFLGLKIKTYIKWKIKGII